MMIRAVDSDHFLHGQSLSGKVFFLCLHMSAGLAWTLELPMSKFNRERSCFAIRSHPKKKGTREGCLFSCSGIAGKAAIPHRAARPGGGES
jgi:hypothetical protein